MRETRDPHELLKRICEQHNLATKEDNAPQYYAIDSYKPGYQKLYCLRKINSETGGGDKISDYLSKKDICLFLDAFGKGVEIGTKLY